MRRNIETKQEITSPPTFIVYTITIADYNHYRQRNTTVHESQPTTDFAQKIIGKATSNCALNYIRVT